MFTGHHMLQSQCSQTKKQQESNHYENLALKPQQAPTNKPALK